ncbi:SET domain-containing protein-lysine N-methyltransferase [Endozoicomonas lisbonensis]|uniref:SET domain-containing protein n=1 Tax=Endozoicomonas lisbonensis TaxID=3120522 RepID=A0ABV2SNR3_9GAMM
MFMIKYLLKPSGVSGIGVFANQSVKKNDIVHRAMLSDDLILSMAEFHQLTDDQKTTVQHFGYFDRRLKKWRLESGDIKFCNHSETPNVTLVNTDLLALSDISSGDEILHNYEEIEESREI